MVCGCGVGAQAARNGNDDSGVHMPCARVRMTFGRPVDPLLHIPFAWGETTAGSGSSDWLPARAVNVDSVGSSTVTAGSMTSSTRDRSQSGRSQRIGIGTAPIFQQPSTANTRCSELGIASATSEPISAPLAVSPRPH